MSRFSLALIPRALTGISRIILKQDGPLGSNSLDNKNDSLFIYAARDQTISVEVPTTALPNQQRHIFTASLSTKNHRPDPGARSPDEMKWPFCALLLTREAVLLRSDRRRALRRPTAECGLCEDAILWLLAPRPDPDGYQFRLGKLNQLQGNFEQAESLRHFLTPRSTGDASRDRRRQDDGSGRVEFKSPRAWPFSRSDGHALHAVPNCNSRGTAALESR